MVIRRILWALGLVKVRVTPAAAKLARGGTLPLTIEFRPKPPRTVSLTLDSNDSSVVRTQPQAAAARDFSSITILTHAGQAGEADLKIAVVPSSRLGRPVQRIFSSFAAKLGFGCATVKLIVGSAPIFVIAPHPDDEALMASGVIASALARGEAVKVIIVTNGDHLKDKKAYGIKRQAESVAAMQKLGLEPPDIIFLGYPGDVCGLLHIINAYLSPQHVYTSIAGARATYGEHGLGNQDFHSWLTGGPAAYNAPNLHGDLEVLTKAFRPEHIYTVSRFDEHPDHRAVNYLTVRVLQTIRRQDAAYAPILHTAIVHEASQNAYDDFWQADRQPPPISTDFSADDFWPVPLSTNDDGTIGAIVKFTSPPHLARTSLTWARVEKMPVPPSMQSGELCSNLKYQALRQYQSQPLRYLASFCKQEELFWREQLSDSELLALAPLEIVLAKGAAQVITVSLVSPAPRRLAVGLETSDKHILAVPPAVIIEAGVMTAAFPVKAVSAGKSTVTAILGAPRELMAVTVLDTAESAREVAAAKKLSFA